MNQRKTKTALLITVSFLLLFTYYHYIDKHINGFPFVILTILIPILFIVIVVNLLREVISITKYRRSLTLLYFLPSMIYLIVPFIPLPTPEQLESKVVLRGCYEGTQNQAYVLFKQDHSFEVHATGVFFYTEWFTGSWKGNKDTISLTYDDNKLNSMLGNKVLIDGGYFKPVSGSVDTGKHHIPMFYMGYCKGEN